METAIITTGAKGGDANIRLARETADRLGFPYVPRGRTSLALLCQQHGAGAALVAKNSELVLGTPAGELFFHPSMAHLRLKNLRQGKPDHLVEALDLAPGMSVLDCTLGLGSDAIVAAAVAGETGRVTGLEASPLIFAVVRHGLAHFSGDNPTICQAMRRVRAVWADYHEYLAAQPDKSVDAVYFDPMFRHPFLESASMNPLRFAADSRPVSEAAIAGACRVARRRVVLKESSHSTEFSRLGFSSFVGGRYSKLRYGVISL